MKKVAVIGAGVVGSVAAYYLSAAGCIVDVYDEGKGQASKAAVGIICPWVSLRRNQVWYELVKNGATFYQDLMEDLEDDSFYTQSGALLLNRNLEKLEDRALERRKDAPIMGDVKILRGDALDDYLMAGTILNEALFVEGAACVDGKAMVASLIDKSIKQGARFIQEAIILDSKNAKVINGIHYDAVIVSAGAWINQVFQDFEYEIDVYPQKGQLIEFKDAFDPSLQHYPYIIPQGELDLMFDHSGSIIVGASHEREKGFDLEVDEDVNKRLFNEALEYLPFLAGKPYSPRVGTRAHTSDGTPFYGALREYPGLYVASGLGSSGLTSGPLMGYRLAQSIITDEPIVNESDMDLYFKVISK